MAAQEHSGLAVEDFGWPLLLGRWKQSPGEPLAPGKVSQGPEEGGRGGGLGLAARCVAEPAPCKVSWALPSPQNFVAPLLVGGNELKWLQSTTSSLWVAEGPFGHPAWVGGGGCVALEACWVQSPEMVSSSDEVGCGRGGWEEAQCVVKMSRRAGRASSRSSSESA